MMCFPKTSKFLPLSCNSVLVLLIGNASPCHGKPVLSFIFTNLSLIKWIAFLFDYQKILLVTRKRFNKALPGIYHLDDSFGCSPGNRMVCKVHSHMQCTRNPRQGFPCSWQRANLTDGSCLPLESIEIPLLPTGCCLCENKSYLTCFTYSSLPEFQV